MTPMRHVTSLQTVYLAPDAGYRLQLQQERVEIHHDGRLRATIPVRRLHRLVLTEPQAGWLRELAQLAERGVPTHIQTASGRLLAAIVPTEPPPDAAVRGLIARIAERDPTPHYRRWRQLQLEHAASLILRHAPYEGVARFRETLHDYVARGVPSDEFSRIEAELGGLLQGWLHAELSRRRLLPLAVALSARDLHLLHDLDNVLTTPLLWAMGPWLRQRPCPGPRLRMQFFAERNSMLERRLGKALAALHFHLREPRGPSRGRPSS